MAFIAGIEAAGVTLYRVATTALMIWMAFLASAFVYVLVLV